MFPDGVEKLLINNRKATCTVNYDTDSFEHTFSLDLVDVGDNKSEVFTKSVCAAMLSKDFSYVEGGVINGAVNNSEVFIENRRVEIPNMFVCDHETTQAEYEKYMTYYGLQEPDSASYYPKNMYKGDNYPVISVSWYEAIIYCNLRSQDENLTPAYYITIYGEKNTDISQWGSYIKKVDGKYYYGSAESSNRLDSSTNGIKYDTTANGYRLPTEAEWEYIAREANATDYLYSGSNYYYDVAWFYENSKMNTSNTWLIYDVKSKNGNIFNIFDMSGNVAEWCFDWYNIITSDTPNNGGDNSSNNKRCIRGGGSSSHSYEKTVTSRGSWEPYYRTKLSSEYNGFRVVRTVYDND